MLNLGFAWRRIVENKSVLGFAHCGVDYPVQNQPRYEKRNTFKCEAVKFVEQLRD